MKYDRLLPIPTGRAMTLHIDIYIIFVSVLTLVRAARRPHPVRPTTAVVLTLLTGVLLWANLRTTPWQADFPNMDCPPGLDPVTGAMFWRGWPLAPCMISLMHGQKFHSGGGEPYVLVLDGVVFLVALYTTKAACERLLLWRRNCN